MPKFPTKTPAWLAGWVALGALLNCAGWLLSALHQLNAVGYAGFFLVTAAVIVWWWRAGNGRGFQAPGFRKQRLRFRRFFPRAFLMVAALAILGGALHAPNNYDALSYRIPRILHWLAAGHWHWVHTIFNRLNTRAVGFEWLAAPVMVFTNTDRWLYLINVISFLLMPGMFFSILIRLGVRPRVAWHWMWLLPTGYNFLLQSASLGNDLFGAIFGLAALDFALRARASKSYADIWLSALAAALLSGSKLSNLPLLLPWFIAFLPSLRLLTARWMTTAAISAVCIVCSLLPMAAINYHYCGDWTGFKAEGSPFTKPDHVLHLEHNTLLMLEENLAPPVFPFARQWNRFMLKLIPPGLKTRLEANFEPSQAHLVLDETQMEEAAGIGFGVTLLLLLSVAAALKRSRNDECPPRPFADSLRWPILLGAFFALAVYMAESGFATEARLATPYYGFVIPALLLGGAQARIVRAKWWRVCALVVYLLAAMLLVIAPARPLWPAQHILDHMHSNSPLVQRAKRVYSVYANRADCFAPVRQFLPPDATVVGLMSFDFPETSLWRPFGTRRVEHVTPADTEEHLRSLGIRYILVSSDEYLQYATVPFDQWLAQIHATAIQTIPLDLRAGRDMFDWRLVRLAE